MEQTVNFARSSKKHAGKDKLIRVVTKATTLGVAAYVVILVGVFGLSTYLQLRAKSIRNKAAERIEQIQSYQEIESLLVGAKKRLKTIRRLRDQSGEGLAAGIDRAVKLIDNRSFIHSLEVTRFGQMASISLEEEDLVELIDVFEDVAGLSSPEGGYNSASLLNIRKMETGSYSYGFVFEVDEDE